MTRARAEQFMDALQEFIDLRAQIPVGLDQHGDGVRMAQLRESMAAMLRDEPGREVQVHTAAPMGLFNPNH